MHLDKTFWGLPWRPHQAGPSVLDRIENKRRMRRELGLAPDVQAERLARQAISRGTVHIRSHVDIDTEIGLRNFEGIMTARRRLKDAVSIQVVAFPQSGVVTRPGTAELLEVGCRATSSSCLGETLGELVVARPVRAWVVSAGRVIARDGHCML